MNIIDFLLNLAQSMSGIILCVAIIALALFSNERRGGHQ